MVRARVDDMDAAPNAALLLATSAALATLLPVAAHQLGALKHLPDPPCAIFDSDAITESKIAHPFGVPDSLPGIVSYGATLALVLLARERPLARRLLAVKLVSDGGVAGFNAVRQVVTFRKLCSWCTGTAICTAAMVFAGRKIITEGTFEAARLSATKG